MRVDWCLLLPQHHRLAGLRERWTRHRTAQCSIRCLSTRPIHRTASPALCQSSCSAKCPLLSPPLLHRPHVPSVRRMAGPTSGPLLRQRLPVFASLVTLPPMPLSSSSSFSSFSTSSRRRPPARGVPPFPRSLPPFGSLPWKVGVGVAVLVVGAVAVVVALVTWLPLWVVGPLLLFGVARRLLRRRRAGEATGPFPFHPTRQPLSGRQSPELRTSPSGLSSFVSLLSVQSALHLLRSAALSSLPSPSALRAVRAGLSHPLALRRFGPAEEVEFEVEQAGEQQRMDGRGRLLSVGELSLRLSLRSSSAAGQLSIAYEERSEDQGEEVMVLTRLTFQPLHSISGVSEDWLEEGEAGEKRKQPDERQRKGGGREQGGAASQIIDVDYEINEVSPQKRRAQ